MAMAMENENGNGSDMYMIGILGGWLHFHINNFFSLFLFSLFFLESFVVLLLTTIVIISYSFYFFLSSLLLTLWHVPTRWTTAMMD